MSHGRRRCRKSRVTNVPSVRVSEEIFEGNEPKTTHPLDLSTES